MTQKDNMILITGAAGFIGSGVVRHLNNQGINNLILVDDLGKDERWKNLVGKQYADLIRIHHLHDWLKGNRGAVRAVIHLGACSSTLESDADYLLENNYRYTLHLAEECFKQGIRFIYASSAATYGDGSRGFSDDHDHLDALEPLNMYGYSKHMFDLWLKRQGLLCAAVGLKYFNVYGPNEDHKGRMASAITHFLPRVKTGEPIRLFKSDRPDYADGEQKRDFIYVKDVARMTCDFIDKKASGIFNVGMGQANSWNSLAAAVFDAVGRPRNIEYIDMPEDLIGKYQYYTRAETEKLEKALGESAATPSLQESVKDYVCNHLLVGKRW
jgi:ADP-L-glycero-D-manno-heptose 6-epimerase